MIPDNLPLTFGVTSFVTTFIVLRRIVSAHNTHQLQFYLQGSIPKWVGRFVWFASFAEILALSLMAAALSLILLSGTNEDRIISAEKGALICLVIAVLTLLFVSRVTRLDVQRWGYVKFSILIGIVFSVMLSGIEDKSADYWFAKLKSGDIHYAGVGMMSLMKPALSQERTVNEIAEVYHKVDYLLSNRVIPEVFAVVVPERFRSWSFILTWVFSAKVAYGFVILPYALLILRWIPRRG